MSRIRKVFSRENITDAFGRLGFIRVRLTHAALLELSLLTLILMLAFTVRLLPMRWGYYLSEFDPYFQYRLTKDIVQNGYGHWLTWQDTMSWWPWGRDVGYTAFPGLAIVAATLYNIFNALGVPMVPSYAAGPLASDPVYNFVIMFPVVMATLTCLAIYFWGKDIGGKEVGLFTAFFLALNGSYIGRTALGFFDDETIGVFSIIMYSLFFLRAVEKERPIKSSILYSIAGGLSLGLLFTAWGASRYPVGVTLLFVMVLLFLRRYSTNLLVSYGITYAVALAIAINVPHLQGIRFLLEITNIAVFGVFALLCAFEMGHRIKTPRMKSIFVLGTIAVGVAAFATLYAFGYIQPIAGRYLSVINPFDVGAREANPIIVSVQEHRPAAWGTLYYDLGVGILFIPVGFYFAAQNPTNRNIYLILFGLTSIYFASTFVRLTLILAPALCILWALALTRVLKPFITLLREKPLTFKAKMRLEGHVGREFSAALLILIFLLLTVTFVFPSTESRIRGDPFPRVMEQAYVPVTIAAASLPIKPDQTVPDWFDALNWMYYNLPSDAVIASWWDYGYWITTIADKRSLVDNATFNTTQIEQVGLMFMSNETGSIEVLDRFNELGQNRGSSSKVDYVVAFFTFDNQGNDVGYGEESKWRWMANIAFKNLTAHERYGNFSLGRNWTDKNQNGQPEQDELISNPLGENTTMYKMMQWGKKQRVESITATEPEHFELIFWSQKDRSPVVTAGGVHALVTVWRVKR
ncbi:MAG TPA: STT3 domain-containing protein [Candidatus Bathyarchaeia archaeon]|nr:STT3 domain-containing protein [Candidatus Bathyarchaeia archaeon]